MVVSKHSSTTKPTHQRPSTWMSPPRANNAKSRKALIYKEVVQVSKHDRAESDPGRSLLCEDCDDFIKALHSHPWNDLERAGGSIGRSHKYASGSAYRFKWRAVDLTGKFPQHVLNGCALCAMIHGILLANLSVLSSNVQFPATQGEWFYVLKPNLYGRISDLDPRRVFGQAHDTKKRWFARWCLGIEATRSPGQEKSYTLPSAIHCAPRPLPKWSHEGSPDVPFEHRTILHGRLRALTCEISLLKSWQSKCDRYHGIQCVRSINEGMTIRCIDVQNECIVPVTLSSPKPVKYVALSYVWGKRQLYAASADEYAALHEHGALKDLKLSQTVADAMLLVREMGLRYLWVDAICIQQTSASDKHEQISQMGFVYQSALFTIVAASGADCDAGLPGLRPGTRHKEQGIVQAGDYTLVEALQSPGDRIFTPQTSTWAQRGWTLQEELLSARQLIFTHEQVWWRCPCAIWSEASQLETNDHVGFLLHNEEIKTRLEDRFAELEPEQYFMLVADYAQRQLSYPLDALDAFSGILSVLTRYSGTQFLWAHMTTDFERQLYWSGKATLREGTRAEAGAGKHVFPTWSWISHQGQISFDHHSRYNPVIECYTSRGDHTSTLQAVRVTQRSNQHDNGDGNDNDDNPTQANNHHHHNNLTNPTTTNNPDGRTVSIEAIKAKYTIEQIRLDFHLFFYTYTATFYLTPQGRLILPNLPRRHARNSKGEIIGPEPDYGYLIPSPDDDAELCEKGFCECVLLGRRPPNSQWDVSHVLVMLVERDQNGVGGGEVRRRLGVADMSEEFWTLADRTWELVALG